MSFERSFANSSAYWATLVFFLVMYFTDVEKTNELQTSNILSTLQLVASFRLSIFFFGLMLGFYFQLIVIFERFCTIFNIKEKRMIKVDESTKKSLQILDQKKYIQESQEKLETQE